MMTQRIAWRRLIIALSAVIAVAMLVVVALLKIGRQNPSAPRAEGAPASTGAPHVEPSQIGTPRQCGTLNPSLSGSMIPEAMFQKITVIHDAACRQDWATLESQMDNKFTSDYGRALTPKEIIRKWREDPDILNVLSAILETQVLADQGGLTYRLGDASLVITRGTDDRPISWAFFVRHCILAPSYMRKYLCEQH